MRALAIDTAGEPTSLKVVELRSQPLDKGQVRIAVRAAGVNFADTQLDARNAAVAAPPQFVPGREIAGDIIEIAEGVTDYKTGDRVVGMIGFGGYATEVVADQSRLLAMPATMSYEDGSIFSTTYTTSYHALKQLSDYTPGEVLLVTGTAGGFGLGAMELGKLLGLNVLAAVGSDDQEEACRKLGVTAIARSTEDRLPDEVRKATGGKGADIIFDTVGRDALEELVRCAGRVFMLGVEGFPTLPADLALLLLKSCAVRGVDFHAWQSREPDAVRKNHEELLGWYAAGKLKPLISMRFPLEEAGKALTALHSRQAAGRIVLQVA